MGRLTSRCDGLLPAPCVGGLRISSNAMKGSVWLRFHLFIICLAALTPDSVFPLAFGFSGESLLNIPFRHKLLELYCNELWSVVADQGGRDSPISRSVPSAHGLLLSL